MYVESSCYTVVQQYQHAKIARSFDFGSVSWADAHEPRTVDGWLGVEGMRDFLSVAKHLFLRATGGQRSDIYGVARPDERRGRRKQHKEGKNEPVQLIGGIGG